MSKIMVNIEAATKKREEAKKQATAAPAQGSNLKSDEIFGMMKVFLERGEGKPLIPKV
jgi:hypothetical protein